MRPTIDDVQDMMTSITRITIPCKITRNKGAVGHLLEDKLGIPRSSACLDCEDGEIKVFPLKKLKNGRIVPKETIAVTMLSTESLRDDEFIDSKCYQKMKKMLIIPYLREDDNIVFFPPTLIELAGSMFELIKADYDSIRSEFLSTGELKSKTGKYLQNRTKGPGGEIKTRAYYLRPAFMSTFVNW